MDYRPHQNQDDQSDSEFEIADIDAEEAGEAGDRSARPSPMFPFLAHHARLWSVFAIFTGCVIIGILLFPDVASVVKPKLPSPTTAATPTVKPNLFVVAGRDNVTLVMRTLIMGVQTNAQAFPREYIGVTAYDTQSGALLWHTPQSQSSPITTYRVVGNITRQASDIYALRSDGLFSLLASRTGKVIWSYKMRLNRFDLVAVRDDVLLLRSDNTFYAVKDGRLLWHNAELGELLALENGVMYTYNSMQQCYYAINEGNGARLWSYEVPQSIQSSSQTFPIVAIENNIFYVQTIDNKVLAIDSQGHVLWSHPLNETVSLNADARYLYIVDQIADTIEALNLQTGKQERTYTNEMGAMRIIDSQNDLLYIQADDGVRAINTETGKRVWQKATNSREPIWAANGILYVFPLNSTDAIQVLNERDGTLLWSGVIQGQFSFDTRGLAVWSSDNSSLSVLRLSDGKTLWSKHIE